MWEIIEIDTYCIHVIPQDDIKRHLASRKCPCAPYTKDGHWEVWLHDSYDLREVAEEDEDVEAIIYETKQH